MDVVAQVLMEGSVRTDRSVGSVKRGSRARPGKLGSHNGVLPPQNRRDPTAPLPIVTEKELNKGIYSCISRGLIPATFDVSAAMGGESGILPLEAEPINLQPHADQFSRRELLTAEYGLAPICNLKLDIQDVLRTPASPEAHLQQGHEVSGGVPVSPGKAAGGGGGGAADGGDEAEQAGGGDHLGQRERDETRTYTELLDMYSLHEFVIRKGSTLSNTPEFQSYQRSHKQHWGAISEVLVLLEKLLTEYNAPLAYIDGKAVAKLAQVQMGTPSRDDLLGCIANRDDVSKLIALPGRKFQTGDTGVSNAAVKVQSVIRMWLQKRRFRDLRESHFAATLIQSHWQIHQQHMLTRSRIRAALGEEEQAWRKTMDNFIRNWGRIRTEKRVVVHLPSLSYTPLQCGTLPYFNCFQNAQLARLIDLVDPNVELIYVSPFPIEHEAVQYYTRLLQLAGVTDAASRVQIVVPENQGRLPHGLSLSKAMLFSQRNLKRLSSLVKGKTAYLVPGVVGHEDLQLAGRLNLPVLGPDPAVAGHFASKSGAKRIFELADVVTPIGAYDMFEEGELLVILSKFIAEYPEHAKWLIKIDNEFNGRGIAVIDVRRLRCIEDDAQQKGRSDTATLREHIYLELKDYIGKRVKIITPQAYPDWASFMQAFNTHGGVVEAVPPDCVSSPVANLYIHPDGAVQILSVQEQMQSPQYCGIGAIFPQTFIPHAAVRDAALSIGCVCYQKKIMGYASVEFVVFRRGGQLRMWAVDLELHLTNNSLAHRLFQFTTCSRMDPESGLAITPEGEACHYTYSGLVYHPYLAAIRHTVFFKRCKMKGLAFDTVERTGTVFHLVDSLLRGCLGVLSIAKSEEDAIRLFSEAMDFIQQQLTNSSAEVADSNFFHAAAASRALFQKVIAQRRVWIWIVLHAITCHTTATAPRGEEAAAAG